MCVRILIVDDHEVVRMGLRMLFATRPGWEICGEAIDGHSAIKKVSDCTPDVVILDLSLPGGMNGFDVVAPIRRIAPSAKIILYSLHKIPVITGEVGADAFVSKSSGASELLATIDRLIETSVLPA